MIHHDDEVGEVTFRVVLESEEHGREFFDYDSPREAIAAVKRLVAKATDEARRDGIERTVGVAIVPASGDEFEEGWNSPPE